MSLCCREVRGISIANVVVFSWIILFCDEENDEEVAVLVIAAGVVQHWDSVLVAAAGVVQHWDGSLDGVASLWPSKEHVPVDGTRFEQGFPRVTADGTRFGQGFPRVAADGTRSFIHPFALNGCV